MTTVAGSTFTTLTDGFSTLALSIPGGAIDGDYLLAIIAGGNGALTTASTLSNGFHEIMDFFGTPGGIGVGADAWVKAYTGDEGGSVSFPINDNLPHSAALLLVRGIDEDATAIGAVALGQADDDTDTATAPALAGVAGVTPLSLRIFVNRRNSAGAITWGAPTVGTEIDQTSDADVGMMVASQSVSEGPVTLVPSQSVASDADQKVAGITMLLYATIEEGLDPAASEPRIRSDFSSGVQSLFRTVRTIPQDVGASETFPPGDALDNDTARPFTEFLNWTAIPDAYYFPRPTEDFDLLRVYQGVTMLERLGYTYPSRVLENVSEIPELAAIADAFGRVTLQEAVQWFFDRWETEFGILFAPVPDLRYRVPYLNAPSDYDSDAGVVRTARLILPQTKGARRTMREIIDMLLSATSGAVLGIDELGRVKLTATVGPDADEEPYKTLGANDIEAKGIGTAEPDSRFVINRADGTAERFTRTDDVEVMQPAWFQMMHRSNFGNTTSHYTAPLDRADLSGADFGDLTPTDSFSHNRPALWPVADDVLAAGTTIRLTDTLGTDMVTAEFKNDSGGTIAGTVTITSEIPLDGSKVQAFVVQANDVGDILNVTVMARYVNEGGNEGIEFSFDAGSLNLTSACFIPPCSNWTLQVFLNSASRAWAEQPPLQTSFGYDLTNDFIPAAGGGNALEESQVVSIRTGSIQVEMIEINIAELHEMVEGYVWANIQPKRVRTIKLAPYRYGGYYPKLYETGRLLRVEPIDEQGFQTSRSYFDDFGSVLQGITMGASVVISLPDPDAPGAIDEDFGALLLDDGVYFALDDGAISEVN